jgi:hypothetical protein
MNRTSRNALLLFLCWWGPALVIGSLASCQTAKAPEYKPNELQMLKLQVRQKDAQIKKQSLVQAQAEFQAAYGALMDEENAIKKENKWPDTLLFDPDKLQFTAPPKPVETPKPAEPPKPAKK